MALQDYTFSDGTFIPKGTILAVPSMPHQMDADTYANPDNFEPFRFENTKEGDVTRKHFTTADPSYMGFGLGMSHLKMTMTATIHTLTLTMISQVNTHALVASSLARSSRP
jgi:cytochrome P450